MRSGPPGSSGPSGTAPADGSQPAAAGTAPHAPLGPDELHLDVFAPDQSFSPPNPGAASYVVSVCLADEPPPSLAQLQRLERAAAAAVAGVSVQTTPSPTPPRS